MLRVSARAAPVAATLMVGAAMLAACAAAPTPYQPYRENGGYEEARLAPTIYRVSFEGNADTREVDVIDFAFLRCAQLTQAAGYTHFVVLQQTATGQVDAIARPGYGMGYGSGLGRGPSFGGAVFFPAAPGYDYFLNHRLAVLVIKMLHPEEAKAEQAAFEAEFLLGSLHRKLERGQRKDS